MDVRERIVRILEANPFGLTAREIAERLNNDGEVAGATFDKSLLNSRYLFAMKDVLIQDGKSYKWFLISKMFKAPSEFDERLDFSYPEPAILFEYVVKLAAKKQWKNPEIIVPKTKKEWGTELFEGLEHKQQLADILISNYSPYFKKEFVKDKKPYYSLNIDRIMRHFPEFFDGYVKERGLDVVKRVIDCELELVKEDPKNENRIKISGIRKIPSAGDVYGISLIIDSDELEPLFKEDSYIELHTNGKKYECTCIGFELTEKRSILYVSCKKKIVGNKGGYILTDSCMILEKLQEALASLTERNVKSEPLKKFLEIGADIDMLSVVLEDAASDYELVRFSQRPKDEQNKAYWLSLKNDLSFIWGPPGTGKSYTLVALIRALHHLKEKTLVCCITNVAVDHLVGDVIDDFGDKSPKNGEFCRSGRTSDSKVLGASYLFPNDSETEWCRRRIIEINSELDNIRESGKSNNCPEVLVLKEEKYNLSDYLKNRTKEFINNTNVVFSTIANVFVDDTLKDMEFDNLIVDEVSMLSMPHLFGLAKNVRKRVILVGDPKQLGPISSMPHNMWRTNVFDQYNILTPPTPALTQLKKHWRCRKEIVDIINNHFYDEVLKPQRGFVQSKLDDIFPDRDVFVYSNFPNNEAKYYGTSSKCNSGSLKKVLSVLIDIKEIWDEKMSVGIITPYRGQVKLYLEALATKHDEFWKNIKVGTIHSFQGSECNVIILDLVETNKVGMLYSHVDGERLVNVAISRAKDKLVIVGDLDCYCTPNNQIRVSKRVVGVMKDLKGMKQQSMPVFFDLFKEEL